MSNHPDQPTANPGPAPSSGTPHDDAAARLGSAPSGARGVAPEVSGAEPEAASGYGGDGAGSRYGGDGAAYGTESFDPHAYTGMPERPVAFSKLLSLTLVSLGVYVLNGLANILDTAFYSPSILPVIGSVIGLGLGCGLYLLVYSGLRKVRNWARIAGVVFAIIAMLGAALSFLEPGMYRGVGFFFLFLAAAIIVANGIWLSTALRAPVPGYFAAVRRAG